MKKVIGILAILGLVIMFVGCKGTTDSGTTPTPTYTVTFDINDESSDEIVSQSIKKGLKITKPIVHAKNNKAIVGWYKEEECTNQWNFTTDVVIKDIILYAKWVECITSATVGNMIKITGGTFSMGSSDDSDSNEYPAHNVTVSDFYMGETEVTQGQWEAVMGADWPGSTKETFPGTGKYQVPSSSYGDGDNNPAYYISWYDAVEFCNALSVLESLTPVYYNDETFNIAVNKDTNNTGTVYANWDANGYRLPTEAEWEYAAGGGSVGENRTVYAGTSTDGNEDSVDDLGDYAWYLENNGSYGTKEVGKKKANSLGLYDMSGNVGEWCWDCYGSSYDTSETENPKGDSTGRSRVERGGRWLYNDSYCRVAYRSYYYANFRFNILGFRVARSCSF